MKNLLLFTALFVFCFAFKISAQNQDLIIGKWQFHEMIGSDLDEKKVEMAQAIFGGTKLEFNQDQSYKMTMIGREEIGSWTINGLVVKLKSSGGKEKELNLDGLTNNEMILNIGSRSKGLMKLVKVEQFKSPRKNEKVKAKNVKATIEQIQGTWYFKEKVMSSNDEEAVAELMLIGLLESAYFKYGENSYYEDDVSLGQISVGTWKLEKDNTVLVVTKDGDPIRYDIIKITESEMRLISEKLAGVMTFVRTKTTE